MTIHGVLYILTRHLRYSINFSNDKCHVNAWNNARYDDNNEDDRLRYKFEFGKELIEITVFPRSPPPLNFVISFFFLLKLNCSNNFMLKASHRVRFV